MFILQIQMEMYFTQDSSGQSDRYNEFCGCQNSINDKFVPDNVRDRTLLSRLAFKYQPSFAL